MIGFAQICISVLIASARAVPVADDPYADPYYDDHPTYYQFGYQVSDEYTQDYHGHMEHNTGDLTHGEYKVQLPDGRLQVVTYEADDSGYRPTVSYEYPSAVHNQPSQSLEHYAEHVAASSPHETVLPGPSSSYTVPMASDSSPVKRHISPPTSPYSQPQEEQRQIAEDTETLQRQHELSRMLHRIKQQQQQEQEQQYQHRPAPPSPSVHQEPPHLPYLQPSSRSRSGYGSQYAPPPQQQAPQPMEEMERSASSNEPQLIRQTADKDYFLVTIEEPNQPPKLVVLAKKRTTL